MRHLSCHDSLSLIIIDHPTRFHAQMLSHQLRKHKANRDITISDDDELIDIHDHNTYSTVTLPGKITNNFMYQLSWFNNANIIVIEDCPLITSIPNTLYCKEFYCPFNNIASLPPMPYCTVIDCSHNQLRELPSLPRAIKVEWEGNDIPIINFSLKFSLTIYASFVLLCNILSPFYK